jgi:Predicted nucleic acid-binding protein, contains PIN domain
MYLLDTNICIFAINKKSIKVLNCIRDNIVNDLYISALTIAELEYGVENSKQVERNRTALLKFISVFSILDFTEYDGIEYGKLKSKLRKRGEIIGPIDMLLAAQALSNKMIFVTNNVKEFERVDGLRIEDWTN